MKSANPDWADRDKNKFYKGDEFILDVEPEDTIYIEDWDYDLKMPYSGNTITGLGQITVQDLLAEMGSEK